MTTIMSWRSGGGKKGSCNANCHGAKLPKCVCICGGRFHGSASRPGGVEQTVRDYWDDVLEESQRKAEEQGLELETERWAKNRQRILGAAPQAKRARQEVNQLRLPLEVR